MVRAQFKFWRKHPPMYRLLEAYVGFRPERELGEDLSADPQAVNQMIDQFQPDELPNHLRVLTPRSVSHG